MVTLKICRFIYECRIIITLKICWFVHSNITIIIAVMFVSIPIKLVELDKFACLVPNEVYTLLDKSDISANALFDKSVNVDVLYVPLIKTDDKPISIVSSIIKF
jgi:hypothetical protein